MAIRVQEAASVRLDEIYRSTRDRWGEAQAESYITGLCQVAEQRLVQELVPHPAVEAFDETVLHRLARRDVVPFDLVLGAPLQDRVRGQFGPVVRHDHAGLAAAFDQRRQFPRHTAA